MPTKDREKLRASRARRGRRYRQRHKAKIRKRHRLYQRRYRKTKPEKIKKWRKDDWQRHGVRRRAQLRARERTARAKTRRAAYVRANPETIRAHNAKYYVRNRETLIAQKTIYVRIRRSKDVTFAVRLRLRSRVASAVRRYLRGSTASATALVCENLGCSVSHFVHYLESKFLPFMCWENRHCWHIDHIRPLARFNLAEPEQLKQALHYTNLQPLWAVDNLRKGSKWP